ncbi:MAG: TetR/AcrR family transcriptional regulator [Hyphomicrobiaceae bacterium]|nr:TetR/AcrR family transcriptional regulator [Hyphomicrobiaceae bacterium]
MSRSVAAARTRAGKRSTAESGGVAAEPRRSGEIIDAAARVFASKGFHGASTQDIADELGIRQASIYYYFPSKEVALEKVCLIGAEGFYERAKAIAEDEGKAADKIARLCAAHTDPLLDRADYVRVFLTQRQFLPQASRRKIGRWSRGLERAFERVIAAGIDAGEFDKGLDARLSTLALLGALNAVPLWLEKENFAVDTIAGTISKIFLQGMMKC